MPRLRRRLAGHPRERSAAAAERFVEEIKQAMGRFLEVSQRWPTGFRGTRNVKLPSFPFLISYRKSDHTIAVLAIVHGRRRPGYWMERAKRVQFYSDPLIRIP
jgi:plasmid stabilization system protein ParE